MQTKNCKRSPLQRLKPLLSLGALALVSQSNLLPARADSVGPTFSNTNPVPGQYVYSLKSTETNAYIYGQVNDVDGINRVAVFLRRYSDGAYWTGSNWQYPSAAIANYLFAQSSTSALYGAYNGPPAAAIIAGQQYLVTVNAVDNLGNVSSYSATVIGVD